MSPAIVVVLVVVAFFVGRLVQWARDAHSAMGSRPRSRR